MSKGNFGHKGRPGQVGGSAAGRRLTALPASIDLPIAMGTSDSVIKQHPSYAAAKSGDIDSAAVLLRESAFQFIVETGRKFGRDVVFVAPHAIEATGENAIPQALAACLAVMSGGSADSSIVQRERVFHTGADPMERIIARPHFDGNVVEGAKYALVDDVSTMGTTLAELSHFIQHKGGAVAGAVLLVNASRSGRLAPAKKVVSELKRRHGNGIEEIFGIQPEALTADEANYLIGFRTTDEIRNRVASAREKTDLRLHSKGIRRLGDFEKSKPPIIVFFTKRA